LRALAVTLPLGLDPQLQVGGAPPPAPLPAELQADREALGAVGVLWDEGRVCVSLGLRRNDAEPEVRHSLWRPGSAPSRGTVLLLEKLPGHDAAGEFDLWSACTRAAAPRDGASLSLLLADPGETGAQRRRIDLQAGERGTWAWRLIHPLESTIEVLPVAAGGARASARAGNATANPPHDGG
jgi:hypothetical protein